MKKSLLFLTFIMTLLVGCGFHLRGIIDLPLWLNQVAVINQGVDKRLETLLKEQLEDYKVPLSSEPATASYWIILAKDTYQQQIVSISSSTTPRQYQLLYSVYYRLESRSGKIIVPASQAIATRQLTVNSDRILGSNDEEAILKQEMKKDAVIQILNRISRYK